MVLSARPFLAALFLGAIAIQSAPAEELKAWLGSAFTAPGEESAFWISVTSDTRPAELPRIPKTANLTFKFQGDPIFASSTRDRIYVYKYAVLSYEEGSHHIPPFELDLKGTTMRSQPLKLYVAELPETAWFDQNVLGTNYRFASKICLPQRPSFAGETTSAEVKIYFPAHFKVNNGTIAELEHDGVAAERFDISSMIHRRNFVVTTARLKGKDYLGVAYRSTVTPIHDGAVAIGPGRARLTLEGRIANRGFTENVRVPLDIPVARHAFHARALPQPAPDGFQNAVGSFIISAQAESVGLREEDPVSIRLTVSGTGNLDTIEPPKLTGDESNWKAYPAHRLERKGAHSDASGVAVFSQVIRPQGLQQTIPPYRLIAFDPQQEQYVTVATPPIPLELVPASSSGGAGALLPDLDTPVEEMESILGLVDPTRSEHASNNNLWKAWQLLPALLALALLAQIARTRILPRWKKPAIHLEIDHAIQALEQSDPGTRNFLRSCGNFIEQWIPTEHRDGEICALLDRRDRDCYRRGSESEQISQPDRSSILAHLRDRAFSALPLLILCSCLLLPGMVQAATDSPSSIYARAETEWNQKDYRSAIRSYLAAHPTDPLPPDVLFNIANCYFQLEERGLATLYYRRALHLDPDHAEARQNLGFLKRKTGAITIERSEYEQWLGTQKRGLYSTVTTGGIWMTVLGLLALFATRGFRTLIWTNLSLGPLLALGGGVCLILYPDDLEFAPIEEQATMINKESIKARTEAANISPDDFRKPEEGGPVVIEVPPGSLCRPLAKRGPWTYIELANDIRGWVPSELVRSILPIEEDRPNEPVKDNA